MRKQLRRLVAVLHSNQPYIPPAPKPTHAVAKQRARVLDRKSSLVHFVRDIDRREEGLFLGGALEANAVRQLVVDVAVLWVGAYFLPVDSNAETLFVER